MVTPCPVRPKEDSAGPVTGVSPGGPIPAKDPSSSLSDLLQGTRSCYQLPEALPGESPPGCRRDQPVAPSRFRSHAFRSGPPA